MANTFELPSKDGNVTPEKGRKSRQMQFRDKTAYVWGLRYRGSRIPGSPTLCHPAAQEYIEKSKVRGGVVIEGGPTNLDKAALAFKVISSLQLFLTVFANQNK